MQACLICLAIMAEVHELRLTLNDVRIQRKRPPQARRARQLVVCRESDENAGELLRNLIATTILPVRDDLDGADEVIEWGLAPLKAPETLPEGMRVTRIVYEKAKAVLFGVGDTYYLFSLSSAAKQVEATGENPFSMILVHCLQKLCPVTVTVAYVGRLIRAIHASNDVVQAIQVNVDVLAVNGARYDFAENPDTAAIMLNVLASQSSAERTQIVTRQFNGKLSRFRAGKWVLGESAIPPGYRLDRDGFLVVDPSQTELLLEILTMLADPNFTPKVVAARYVRRVQEGQPRLGGRALDDDQIAHGLASNAFVARIMRWAGLLETGEHVYTQQIPYKVKTDELMGIPVSTDPETGISRVHMRYVLPRPEIPATLVRQAIRVRAARGKRGGSTLDSVTPLVARTWETGQMQYRLGGGGRGFYELRQRQASSEDIPWSVTGGYDGIKIAAIKRQSLHDSLRQGFAAGLRSGVAAQLLATSSVLLAGDTRDWLVTHDDQVGDWQAEAELLEQRADVFFRRARKAPSPKRTEMLLDAGEDLLAEAAAIRERIENWDGASDIPRDREFVTDSDVLLEALAALTEDNVSQIAYIRLGQVLDAFTIRVDDGVANWSAELLVPTSEGIVRLGPFLGSVATAGFTLAPAQRAASASGQAHRRRYLASSLGEAGMSSDLASAAASSPHQSVARELLLRLTPSAAQKIEPAEWHNEPGFDAEVFADHLVRVYTGPQPQWAGRRYIYTDAKRQRFVQFVAAVGGRATKAQIEGARDYLGFGDYDIYRLSLPAQSSSQSQAWQPPVRRTETDNDVALVVESILCPACHQPATGVIRVGEVPGDLLCTDCLRAPADPAVAFPASYRDLVLPVEPVPDAVIQKALERARLDAILVDHRDA